jgi:hypothetical protein
MRSAPERRRSAARIQCAAPPLAVPAPLALPVAPVEPVVDGLVVVLPVVVEGFVALLPVVDGLVAALPVVVDGLVDVLPLAVDGLLVEGLVLLADGLTCVFVLAAVPALGLID